MVILWECPEHSHSYKEILTQNQCNLLDGHFNLESFLNLVLLKIYRILVLIRIYL